MHNQESSWTSIAAWAGVDSRGVASLYVASDSQITWLAQPTPHIWTQARKVFACMTKPHLFGYFGDVLFPALALPVIVDRIDRGLLTDKDNGWHRNVQEALRRLASTYPIEQRGTFGIFHGYRVDSGMKSKFHLGVINYTAGSDNWTADSMPMPEVSSFIHIEGSGASTIKKTDALWRRSPSGKTSRAVYGAFHESVVSGADHLSGGAPQVGAIYRIGPAHLIGIVLDNERYFAGAKLTGREDPSPVEWRNDLFERVDGVKKKRLPAAQEHHPRN